MIDPAEALAQFEQFGAIEARYVRLQQSHAALIEAAKDVLKHDSLAALGRLEDAVREAERES